MSAGSPIQPVQEFFSIGEVCQLTDLKPHVLRYWESQFRFLNPAKNRSGNRVYQRREIELIMLVKHLLYTEKYTIEGARQKIEQYRRSGELKPEARRAPATPTVTDLRSELKSIPAIPDGTPPPHAGAGSRPRRRRPAGLSGGRDDPTGRSRSPARASRRASVIARCRTPRRASGRWRAGPPSSCARAKRATISRRRSCSRPWRGACECARCRSPRCTRDAPATSGTGRTPGGWHASSRATAAGSSSERDEHPDLE